ncbi:MAG: AEC family transporter [SAR324 cluster bacterium]|nr:AEC family transporter [SAR324 cluster bacterium]
MIVTAVLPIFILIGLGFLLKNHFSFGEGFWDTSNRLIFWVLFPSLLFTSMSRAELAQLPTGGMAVAVIPAILTVAFLTLVVQKTYPMDTRGFTSVFQGSIRLNTYLGLAIAGGVMGAKGLEYAAYTPAVMITLVNFLSVVTVERFVGMNSGCWSLLKSVLANPLILACVLGMFSAFFI